MLARKVYNHLRIGIPERLHCLAAHLVTLQTLTRQGRLRLIGLAVGGMSEAQKAVDFSLNVPDSSKVGLRMVMTVIPIIGLFFGIWWFRRKYNLSDERMKEITEQLAKRK